MVVNHIHKHIIMSCDHVVNDEDRRWKALALSASMNFDGS